MPKKKKPSPPTRKRRTIDDAAVHAVLTDTVQMLRSLARAIGDLPELARPDLVNQVHDWGDRLLVLREHVVPSFGQPSRSAAIPRPPALELTANLPFPDPPPDPATEIEDDLVGAAVPAVALTALAIPGAGSSVEVN